jgi:hypothetical protein
LGTRRDPQSRAGSPSAALKAEIGALAGKGITIFSDSDKHIHVQAA